MALSKNPAFNLKVVLQETNLAADTLRAWERRYGLPMPRRTAGGHRLYSQYDIETVKWLLARQSEGLSISRAVDSWNEKIASGIDPLAGLTSSIFAAVQNASPVYVSPNTSLDTLRAQWISSCTSFNEANAEQALNQAFSIFPVEAVCTEVLQKGLSEIGDLWYENQASVQQEHFASGLAMRRLDTLVSACPMPTRSQTILIGCPAGEWHTFTPLLLSLFLRRRGLYVVYLGADVPAEKFEETVKAIQANLVVLVSQQLITAASLQQTAQMLFTKKIPVAYSGRIFTIQPEIIESINGYYLGTNMEEAVDQIESLASAKVRSPQAGLTAQHDLAARDAFIAKRTQIEGTFREWIQPHEINDDDLNTGIRFLGDNIAAALQLGNMNYVSSEIEWLRVLLQFHHRPIKGLADFLTGYSRAVDKSINDQGESIKTWLKAQAAAG